MKRREFPESCPRERERGGGEVFQILDRSPAGEHIGLEAFQIGEGGGQIGRAGNLFTGERLRDRSQPHRPPQGFHMSLDLLGEGVSLGLYPLGAPRRDLCDAHHPARAVRAGQRENERDDSPSLFDEEPTQPLDADQGGIES